MSDPTPVPIPDTPDWLTEAALGSYEDLTLQVPAGVFESLVLEACQAMSCGVRMTGREWAALRGPSKRAWVEAAKRCKASDVLDEYLKRTRPAEYFARETKPVTDGVVEELSALAAMDSAENSDAYRKPQA